MYEQGDRMYIDIEDMRMFMMKVSQRIPVELKNKINNKVQLFFINKTNGRLQKITRKQENT
jgi:hypothetical protein